jgi:hypothetical protein
MKKKYRIKVKRGGQVIEEVQRVLWAEAIGNFNPLFCRYKGKRTLVQSEEGNISDPFRRRESYLTSLYIEVKEE